MEYRLMKQFQQEQVNDGMLPMEKSINITQRYGYMDYRSIYLKENRERDIKLKFSWKENYYCNILWFVCICEIVCKIIVFRLQLISK